MTPSDISLPVPCSDKAMVDGTNLVSNAESEDQAFSQQVPIPTLPSNFTNMAAGDHLRTGLQNILVWLIVSLFLVGLVLVICTVFIAKGLCPAKTRTAFSDCNIRISRHSADSSRVTEELQLDDLQSPDHRATNHNRHHCTCINSNEVSMTMEGQDPIAIETILQAPPPYSIAVNLPGPDIFILPSLEGNNESCTDTNNRPSSLPTYEEALASGTPVLY